VNDFEAWRGITQQAMRTRDVARREDEAIAAVLQRLQQLALDMAQSGKALERSQLEHFIQEERRRTIQRAGAGEMRQRVVEGFARAARRLCRHGCAEG
jgi:hypothetical protein